MIRTSLRYLFRILLAILACISLWLLLALLLPYFSFSDAVKEKKDITVYVSSNGIHTDFVMPVYTDQFNWAAKIHYSDFELAGPEYKYVAVGWGDKGFFIATPTWDDLTFSTAFNAAFGLSSTAMHVTYKKYELKESETCVKLVLSEAQYQKLIEYIISSFESRDGEFQVIDHPGYTSHDKFYEARGTYNIFNTCNVWTGEGLEAIGAPVGVWTPLPGGVLQNLK